MKSEKARRTQSGKGECMQNADSSLLRKRKNRFSVDLVSRALKRLRANTFRIRCSERSKMLCVRDHVGRGKCEHYFNNKWLAKHSRSDNVFSLVSCFSIIPRFGCEMVGVMWCVCELCFPAWRCRWCNRMHLTMLASSSHALTCTQTSICTHTKYIIPMTSLTLHSW